MAGETNGGQRHVFPLQPSCLTNKVLSSNPRPGVEVFTHCSDSVSWRKDFQESHLDNLGSDFVRGSQVTFSWCSGMGQCWGESPKVVVWVKLCLRLSHPTEFLPSTSCRALSLPGFGQPSPKDPQWNFSGFNHCQMFSEQNMSFSPENRTFCWNKLPSPPVLSFPLAGLPPRPRGVGVCVQPGRCLEHEEMKMGAVTRGFVKNQFRKR